MKLSLTKKFGWIWVRGGRLVRVVHPYSVSAGGMAKFWKDYLADRKKHQPEAKLPPPPFYGETADVVPGDLAIEIMNVKTGGLVGRSYLTGQAVAITSYDLTRPDRYEEAYLAPFLVPDPGDIDPDDQPALDAFQVAFLRQVVDAKYGGVDVHAVIDPKFGNFETAKNFATILMQSYGYDTIRRKAEAEELARNPVGPLPPRLVYLPERAPRGHIIGTFQLSKKAGVTFHAQPPHHASDYAASPFQAGLLTSAVSAPPP